MREAKRNFNKHGKTLKSLKILNRSGRVLRYPEQVWKSLKSPRGVLNGFQGVLANFKEVLIGLSESGGVLQNLKEASRNSMSFKFSEQWMGWLYQEGVNGTFFILSSLSSRKAKIFCFFFFGWGSVKFAIESQVIFPLLP